MAWLSYWSAGQLVCNQAVCCVLTGGQSAAVAQASRV